MTIFLRRKFCDQVCMARSMIKTAVTREGYYARARRFRKAACERCGATEKLHVHHKNHDITDQRPENLVTLCRMCHTKDHIADRRRAVKGSVVLRVETFRLLASLLARSHKLASKTDYTLASDIHRFLAGSKSVERVGGRLGYHIVDEAMLWTVGGKGSGGAPGSHRRPQEVGVNDRPHGSYGRFVRSGSSRPDSRRPE